MNNPGSPKTIFIKITFQQTSECIYSISRTCLLWEEDSFTFSWPSWAHLKSLPSWEALRAVFNYTLSFSVMRLAQVQPHRWYWSTERSHLPVITHPNSRKPQHECKMHLHAANTQQMLGVDAIQRVTGYNTPHEQTLVYSWFAENFLSQMVKKRPLILRILFSIEK